MQCSAMWGMHIDRVECGLHIDRPSVLLGAQFSLAQLAPPSTGLSSPGPAPGPAANIQVFLKCPKCLDWRKEVVGFDESRGIVLEPAPPDKRAAD